MPNRDSILRITEAMNRSVLGQETVVERLIIALLVNGNVLLEGLPGTAKTRSIKTLANVLEADLSRPAHQAAVLELTRAYARDPMGSGTDLPPAVQRELIEGTVLFLEKKLG